MNARWPAIMAALGVLVSLPATGWARGLGVEVWTDRGDDAVYQPGQAMEIKVRASDDAYLIVYEIDAEGYVRLLHPYRGSSGFVEGRHTYPVPPERSNVDLVVQGPVGQCYVVAIAARERFRDLPGYLRPHDLQGQEVGYEGMRDDDEGITSDGRVVGDPFVAMERIRRRVLVDARNADDFGTSYATYYVHNEVKYPRYLCYDCHRPGRWAWGSGFDPYYASCSVIELRVNWGWGWGPGYWFGSVPYYNYMVRRDCPPRYVSYFQDRACFSSWDGWRRWNSMWGNRLVRYKSDQPSGPVALPRFRDGGGSIGGKPSPPGFIAGGPRPVRNGQRPGATIDRDRSARPRERMPREITPGDGEPTGWRTGPGARRPVVERPLPREVIREREDGGGGSRGSGFRERPAPRAPRLEEAPRPERPRAEKPRDAAREAAPRVERPREERPADRSHDQRAAPSGRSPEPNPRGHRTKG